MNDIWDAIIGNSFDYEINEDISTDLLNHYDNIDSENRWDNLNLMLKSDKATAESLFHTIYDILLQYTDCGSGDASLLSQAMLVKGGNDAPKENYETLASILIPNLYCILLLEADVRQTNTDSPLTLTDFLRENSTDDIDYSQIARVFTSSYFLPKMREFLGVQPKAGNERYQISTNFPNLLLGILKNISISPLTENKTTASSHVYNTKFYKKCFAQIAPENIWTEKSFEEYYILERIFRIDTKLGLFEYVISGDDKRNNTDLHPHKLLADFFFSSPLVILPQNLVSLLFTNGFIPYDGQKITAVESLYFLILLSSSWLPQILHFFRAYMERQDITSYNDVKSFLFPDQTYFNKYFSQIKPMDKKYDSSLVTRAAKDAYLLQWNDFAPYEGYCSPSMKWCSLRDWSQKVPRSSYSIVEINALGYIQEALL